VHVARQRLGKNVTAAMNTHESVGGLLEAPFSIQSMSYEKKRRD
jgi:hypothetical protein